MAGNKALIVDDSKLAQFVLKKMLVEQNLSVDTSPSAESALDYLKTHKPDIIFLDHTMPGMNGLEVLKLIKQNPKIASIPVMMYTSQEDSAYMAKAKEVGALAVLPKQLQAAELAKALSRVEFGKKRTVDSPNNLTVDSTITLEENKEELEKLIYNAEIALSHESAQQKLQQKLEQQGVAVEKHLSVLNAKIDAVIPTIEQTQQRRGLWTNLLWGAIYCATVAVFMTLHFQQKDAVEALSNNQTQHATRASSETTNNLSVTSPIENLPEANTQPEQRTSQTAIPASASKRVNNVTQLKALESLANSNNQIPYDELLLGDTVQTTLNELIPSLQELAFTGRVSIIAHDGRFCVRNDDNGQLILANQDIPVTQCQIVEASDRLADIASIELLQSITASNQSSESGFIITIEPAGSTSPLEPYPAIEESVLAGTWNDVALRNKRVDIRLFDE